MDVPIHKVSAQQIKRQVKRMASLWKKFFVWIPLLQTEHLCALFYGFNECETIKKTATSSHSIALSTVAKVARIFCLYWHRTSDSFDYFHLPYYAPVSIFLSFIHFTSYRFAGNCYVIAQEQSRCHSVVYIRFGLAAVTHTFECF